MSHFSRKPVRFIEENQELLEMQKSVSGDQARSPGTDFKGPSEAAFPARMEAQYRTPHDRERGNEMFRRYPDGRLDVNYAAQKVIEAVHKVRDGVPLIGIEQTALSCCFPATFSYVDSGVAAATSAVNLRLSPEERVTITTLVASHLMGEMRYMLSSHAR